MERLAQQSDKNSSSAYDEIFLQRSTKGIDEFDLRRWKVLLKYFRGGRLIDLGCLDSLVSVLAKKKYPKSECWGIDQAGEAIKAMLEMNPEIHYEVGDVYNTKFPTNYFNYVVMGELLEHLEYPEKAVMEAFRILKPEGILAISTPLEEAREPGAVDPERHLWSFTADDIYDLIKPYAIIRDSKYLHSIYFPTYKYAFPNIVVWAEKNKQLTYEELQSFFHQEQLSKVLSAT